MAAEQAGRRLGNPVPDGRRLALQLASGDSNVWMVENF